MQEGNSFSLGSDARFLVDELNTRGAAPLECRVEVVDRKADVMNPGTTLRHKAGNRRRGVVGLQQLDEGLSRAEPHDARSVGIIEFHLSQTHYIAEKGKSVAEGLQGDPNVRNSGATRT